MLRYSKSGIVEKSRGVLDIVSDMTQHTLEQIYEQHAEDLKVSSAKTKLPKGRQSATSSPLQEIHQMNTKATKTDTTTEKTLFQTKRNGYANMHAKN